MRGGVRLWQRAATFAPTAVNSGLIVALAATAAMAQSETQVESGITSVMQLVVRIIGGSVLGFGLIRGFTAYATGDEDGLRTARNAIVGGLGVLFTMTLVSIVTQAAGVAH